MIANYHTHTWRCNHAQGTERETVERAIQAGLKVLGFSDHTPYVFPGDYYSSFRMRPEQLEDYVRTIEALRDEYRGDLEIHIGLEVEYYPAHFADLLKLTQDYPIEYFILGQHFINNEYDGTHSGMPSGSEDTLARYCNQALEGLRTGRFLYFAHPDFINFTGDAAVYEKWIHPLCQSVRAMNLPLEINFLGLGEGRTYPNPRFWKIAAEEGCEVVFGCDAHHPAAVDVPQIEAMALEMVEKLGLRLRERLDLPAR